MKKRESKNEVVNQYSYTEGLDNCDLMNNKKVVDGQYVIIITPTGKEIKTQLKTHKYTKVVGNVEILSYLEGMVQIELEGVLVNLTLYQLYKGGCKIVLADK